MAVPALPARESTDWYAWASGVHDAAGAVAGKADATDPRLSDARTPTAHKHLIADLTATGSPSGTTFLRGDGAWAVPAGGGGTVTAANISDASTVGRNVLTAADGAAARSAIGAAALAAIEGLAVWSGTAWPTRPTGYARIRWVGGTARPTGMAVGDIWERDA